MRAKPVQLFRAVLRGEGQFHPIRIREWKQHRTNHRGSSAPECKHPDYAYRVISYIELCQPCKGISFQCRVLSWGDVICGETVADFILGGLQNHCRWWLQPWKLKMLTLWEKYYDQPRQHIKKQRCYFADKGPSSQGYGFSSSHVWMWVGLWRTLNAEKLMLLNCAVGEDSWESLGLQGDSTSLS